MALLEAGPPYGLVEVGIGAKKPENGEDLSEAEPKALRWASTAARW
jgi:hypothetical protein